MDFQLSVGKVLSIKHECASTVRVVLPGANEQRHEGRPGLADECDDRKSVLRRRRKRDELEVVLGVRIVSEAESVAVAPKSDIPVGVGGFVDVHVAGLDEGTVGGDVDEARDDARHVHGRLVANVALE